MVVCALVRIGATPETMIAWVYANNPVGTVGKYSEAGAHYLTRTIEAAQRATADHPSSNCLAIPATPTAST